MNYLKNQQLKNHSSCALVSAGVFKKATPLRPMTILLSGEVEFLSLAALKPVQSLFQQVERIGLEKVTLSQMVSLKAGP